MKGVAAQVRKIGSRLRARPHQPLELTMAHSGNPKSHDSSDQNVNESRILSALPLIAIASAFNLTTSDAFAFPETAVDLRRKLIEFPMNVMDRSLTREELA